MKQHQWFNKKLISWKASANITQHLSPKKMDVTHASALHMQPHNPQNSTFQKKGWEGVESSDIVEATQNYESRTFLSVGMRLLLWVPSILIRRPQSMQWSRQMRVKGFSYFGYGLMKVMWSFCSCSVDSIADGWSK